MIGILYIKYKDIIILITHAVICRYMSYKKCRQIMQQDDLKLACLHKYGVYRACSDSQLPKYVPKEDYFWLK